jgi:hypothetical protein
MPAIPASPKEAHDDPIGGRCAKVRLMSLGQRGLLTVSEAMAGAWARSRSTSPRSIGRGAEPDFAGTTATAAQDLAERPLSYLQHALILSTMNA